MEGKLNRLGCDYRERCPSASGWCNIGAPSVDCVPHLVIAYINLKHEYEEYKKNGEKEKKLNNSESADWIDNLPTGERSDNVCN